jgi:hypothetical protein
MILSSLEFQFDAFVESSPLRCDGLLVGLLDLELGLLSIQPPGKGDRADGCHEKQT